MTVLCVVAHPDDEVIGVGGTLARHAAEGTPVHVGILADGVTSRYDEVTSEAEAEIERRRGRAREASEELGVESVRFDTFPDNQFDSVPLLDIVQSIEGWVEEIGPDIVYTHHHGDLNVDHERTCRAVLTSARPLPDSGVDRIVGFETLSSSEWSVPEPSNAFQPTTFVDIEEHVTDKLAALRVYEKELRDSPHPRSLEIVEKNAEVWGAKCGVEAAEPFEVLREVQRAE
jgi:LmbE family N-acetylglucosaminyl deacetylase